MSKSIHKATWLDAPTIDSIHSLEWLAKQLANGFQIGKHISSRLGSGIDFHQYRPYSVGDDIRNIDWKIYGKTDKYFVKQTTIDTEHTFVIIMDNSASMKYEENNTAKFTVAKVLAACLSRIISKQGDKFSIISNDSGLGVGQGQKHWNNSLQYLYDLSHSTKAPYLTPSYKGKVLYIWISDFYHQKEDIKNYIKSLKNKNTELILFSLIGSKEKTLDFPREATYIDLETEERIDVNTNQIRKKYIADIAAHQLYVQQLCYKYAAYHHEVDMSDRMIDTLKTFFNKYRFLTS